MSEIKLNFYDEEVVISIRNKTFDDFKKEVAKRYSIDISDVSELIIYYFSKDKTKQFIRKEEDFKLLLQVNKNTQTTIFLEIHEESRLFKAQNEAPFKHPENNPNNFNNKNQSSNVEKIRLEILEKERLLKETIEKERQEIQKKKELAKKQMEEDNKKKKLEELRNKKYQLEKEEEDRKKKEKEELQNEVTRLMNDNLEKIKRTLIDDTVNQSLQIVDKQLEKRMQQSQCKDAHNCVCSSCGLSPIIGVRYSCGINKDFHLCENCEYLVGDSYPYPLLKYRNAVQGKMNISFVVDNKVNNININSNNVNSNNKLEVNQKKKNKVGVNNNSNSNNINKDDDLILMEDLNMK